MSKLVPKTSNEIEQSILNFAESTTPPTLRRRNDIRRDKISAISSFFALIPKEPSKILVRDINIWHEWMTTEGRTIKRINRDGTTEMVKTGLRESTIYTRLSHLSAYFEWLRRLPQFRSFIRINPVRLAMPKPPKKYNSSKTKSLTDEELGQLWRYLETLADDGRDLKAVRDYAIFRIFTATGMRREEVLGLSAGDIRFTHEGLSVRALVKGGDYEWRTISDVETIAAVERYLKLTERKIYVGKHERALWIRLDRGAKSGMYDTEGELKQVESGLTSKGFEKQIKLYAKRSGIGSFHIHQFRHTYARIVAEETGSIIETQDALGHADPQTTRIYVAKIVSKKDKHSHRIRQRIRDLEPQQSEQRINRD